MRILHALRTAGLPFPGRILGMAGVLFALAGLSAGYSAPARAILSCEAGAGPTVSGGSFDSCGLNKYQASTSSNFPGAGVAYQGSAVVSPSNGAQGGAISLFDNTPDGVGPPPANGNFYSNLLVDFRISGPASGGSIPVTVLSGGSGSIAADCVNCEASISYLLRLERTGLLIELTAGRTRSSAWATNTTFIGAAGTAAAVPQGFGGTFTFDAAGLLNQTIRLTSNLSGTVALTGANPEGAAVSADASNTALFNVILPAGYSIVAEPSAVPLLTNPVLQVPEPESFVLLSVGLLALGGVVRRSRAFRR
jgi:hypothetical protein